MSDAVKAALISAFPPLVTGVITWMIARRTHRKVASINEKMNGRLDTYLAIARESGRQEGFQQGVAYTLERLGLPPNT